MDSLQDYNDAYIAKLQNSVLRGYLTIAIVFCVFLCLSYKYVKDVSSFKSDISYLQSELDARDKAIEELSTVTDSLEQVVKKQAAGNRILNKTNDILGSQLVEKQKEIYREMDRADFFKEAATFQEEPRYFSPVIRFTRWTSMKRAML